MSNPFSRSQPQWLYHLWLGVLQWSPVALGIQSKPSAWFTRPCITKPMPVLLVHFTRPFLLSNYMDAVLFPSLWEALFYLNILPTCCCSFCGKEPAFSGPRHSLTPLDEISLLSLSFRAHCSFLWLYNFLIWLYAVTCWSQSTRTSLGAPWE